MTLGECIRSKRKEQGMTLKELSEKSGLSIVSISFYETGKNKPSLTNVSRVAKGLNCDFDELYELWQNEKGE